MAVVGGRSGNSQGFSRLFSPQPGPAPSRPTSSFGVQFNPTLPSTGLVAFWDFTESAAPYVSKQGTFSGSLAQGGAGTVTSVEDGPFGGGILLDGSTGYLTIPAANVGTLNVANSGDAVTVLAWVSRTDLDQGFIGGLWDEANSRRNFGLFLDLATYGGDDQVCGHISDHGGVTPGYTFNRDYSASARKIGSTGGYRFVAFTYDGAQAISYLDGLADSRPTFTDTNAQTYAKNPYAFTAGLNHSATIADFTVGANLVSGPAIGNMLAGRIGGLVVYSRALSAAEVMDVHQSALVPSTSVVTFDWYTPTAGAQIATDFSWKSARAATAVDTGSNAALNNFSINQVASPDGFLYRSGVGDATNITTEGVGYYPTFSGLLASEIETISFRLNNSLAADTLRLAVQIGSIWYASETTYAVTGDGRVAGDWSSAETKTFDMSLGASVWRALTFTPGTALALGSTIATPISDGTVNAVGFYSPAATGVVRIDDFSIYAVPWSPPPQSAALSGSGTLSATQTPIWTQSAAVSGSGTLSATQTPATTQAAGLSGSGTLTKTSTPTFTQTAALSGSGTLSETQTPSATQTAAVSGSGSLTTTQAVVTSAGLSGSGTTTSTQAPALTQNASLTGSGTLSATQTPATTQSAAVSGSGTLTKTQTVSTTQSANVSGSGTLTTTQTVAVTQAAAASGSGSLSTTQTMLTATSAAASGSGALSTTTTPSTTQTAAVSGSGTLSLTQTAATTQDAAVSGSGALSTTRTVFVTQAADLTGSGALSAAQVAIFDTSASVSGSGTLDATSAPSFTYSSSLSGSGTLTAEITTDRAADANATGSGTLTATATLSTEQSASLSGSGVLSTETTLVVEQAADATGSGTLSAASVPSWTDDAELSGSGTLSATAVPSLIVSADLSGSGTLTASTAQDGEVSADFTGSGTLSAISTPKFVVVALFTGLGELTPETTLSTAADLGPNGSGTLTATAAQLWTRAANLQGSGTLTAFSFEQSNIYVTFTGARSASFSGVAATRSLDASEPRSRSVGARISGTRSLHGVATTRALTGELDDAVV